jgi:hypothetical protein
MISVTTTQFRSVIYVAMDLPIQSHLQSVYNRIEARERMRRWLTADDAGLSALQLARMLNLLATAQLFAACGVGSLARSPIQARYLWRRLGEFTPSYILHTRAFGTYLLGGY